VGINLSIPIYQRKQVKTQVKAAQIQVSNAQLELTDMKNNLRKYIEQACTDVQTAQSNYLALQEQLEAEQESYDVASEMFSQGMVNSVDFLLSKNNLIIAENKFTQAKYNLILQNKIVEYYLGKPIEL
jgi:outer membrane protein